jgi:histidyl-tRNA synthetase
LTVFNFPAESHESVLITIDKLDKIGTEGVVAELSERGLATTPINNLGKFLLRPTTFEFNPFGERAIRKALPEGVDEAAIADLVALGEALGDIPLVFDPFLVRGMGYYTGAIFEVSHPDLGYSLGGGGRYDGMIGRFLGSDVPAVGMSLGFERLVDLVSLPKTETTDALVLFYDAGMPVSELLARKTEALGAHSRVRLEQRPKNLAAALARLEAEGFTKYRIDGLGADSKPIG